MSKLIIVILIHSTPTINTAVSSLKTFISSQLIFAEAGATTNIFSF
jgi:hypothetical protein